MNKGLPKTVSALRQFNAQAGANTISLGLGKPYIDMPKELRDLACQMLKNTGLRQDYSANGGDARVRKLLEQNFGLARGSSIITHGAQEALYAALSALLNPGDEVLIPNPGFLAYETMIKMMHGKPTLYPMSQKGIEFTYEIDTILKNTTKKTKAVIINAPGNPTGTTVSNDFITKLASELKKKKIVLISDEVYGELHYRSPYQAYCNLGDNIVTINAFSKSHALTGWRIGWAACANPKITQQILVAHQYLSTCASVPAQHLIGALLADQALYDKIRDGFRTEYLTARNSLLKNLGPAAKFSNNPEAGFYKDPKTFSKFFGLCAILI